MLLHDASKSPLLHGTLKPVATQHPKVHYYMALLQSQLLHGTLKLVVTRHPKARCHMTIFFYKISNYLQKAQILFWQLFTKDPNIILVTIYKSSILFWQLFTKSSNTILAPSIKKPKTIGQTIILPKPKYYLAKELYYAKKPKLFFGKNIFWLWEIEKIASQKERFLECFLGHLSFWVSGVELPLIFL